MSNDSDDSDDLINNATTEDANIFKSLGKSDHPTVAIPEQAASGSDEEPVSMSPLDQNIQFEVANLDSSPLVVIDPFPHGSPGAPTSQDLKGKAVGIVVGMEDRIVVGVKDGIVVGMKDGIVVGMKDGIVVGMKDGIVVGMKDGIVVGMEDGIIVRMEADVMAAKANQYSQTD
ncbi:hypothetical protein F5888DRAFT_1810399 [Russula emetica]|nr:hypothetical protein F5888DRAFT_1810399 [Russula emetica]